jgi:filamentous hemagglutinin family protein
LPKRRIKTLINLFKVFCFYALAGFCWGIFFGKAKMNIRKVLKIMMFAVFGFWLAAAVPAFALPEGQTVESGTAYFEYPDPSTLRITADDKAVINFNSFNIGLNETVNFIQPSANASVLSRVTGNSASYINGSLFANGILYLVNPNGINFGPQADVRVNNLIASTLDINTNNFINGDYIFENKSGKYSEILNQGEIQGTNVALLASAVENSGVIIARAGTVHLASGDKTMVTIDSRGLIQVEVSEATSGKVVDLNTGTTLKDAVSNTGTIEAHHVVMNARTAGSIFENSVNQSGIVKATKYENVNGVIRISADSNIKVSGTLEAEAGSVAIVSRKKITVATKLNTKGDTTLAGDGDIEVLADILTDSGNLSLLADNDLDGLGAFEQLAGTLIATANSGDIIIQSSRESKLANINAYGDLILKQAGAAVNYLQQQGSIINVGGSINIGKGVILSAADAIYNIGKDWISYGLFRPQLSSVALVSAKEAKVVGAREFYNFTVTEPGKIVRFDTQEPLTVINNLVLKGAYGNLLKLGSLNPPQQWGINPQGQTDIQYVLVGDSVNIRGPPLKAIHSSSLGNLTNYDLDPYWTGQGLTGNWSDANNWDTGTVPTEFDTVTFDGVTGTNPNKDSLVDADFGGTIDNLYINGYTGTLTLARNLTLRGNFSHQTGTFNAATYTVTFIDASKPSVLTGNITFYNLNCNTPGKYIYFESGMTYTIEGSLNIQGAHANAVRLLPTRSGEHWNVDPKGPASSVNIEYAWVEDSTNLASYLMPMHYSHKGAGLINWDTDYTWSTIWGAPDDEWGTAANWDDGSGFQPSNAPGSSDNVFFAGGTRNTNCNNVSGGVTNFSVDSAYTGTITVNGGGFTISGELNIQNGIIYVDTSGILWLGGGVTVAGAASVLCPSMSEPGQGQVYFHNGHTDALVNIQSQNFEFFVVNDGSIKLAASSYGGSVLTQTQWDAKIDLNGYTFTLASNYNMYNTSSLYLSGGSLSVTGAFNVSSGSKIVLRGDESLTAPTLNDSSTVEYTGINGTPVTINNWAYVNLTISGAGRTFKFPSGEYIHVTGSFTVTGSSGNLVTLRSSSEGNYWYINPNGGSTVSYVDVKDSYSDVEIIPTLSTNSGHNYNWNFSNVWTNGSSTGLWSTPGNWSSGSVPTSGDIVVFDGTSSDNCSINTAAQAYSISINSGYSGTITANASLQTSGDFTISSGNFEVNGQTVTIGGNFTNSDGGYYKTNSAGSNTIFMGNLTVGAGGNFWAWDAGTITFSGTGSQQVDLGGYTAYDVVMNGSGGVVTLTSAFGVSRNLDVNSGATLSLSGISPSVGGTFTLNSGGTLRLGGSETPTAPSIHSGSTVEYSDGTGTTIKSWNYANLVISGGGTFTLPGETTISGDLTVSSGTLDLATNTCHVSGIVTVAGANLINGTLDFNGAGNQNLNGGTYASMGPSNAVVFTKSSGNIVVYTNQPTFYDVTLSSGTLDLNGLGFTDLLTISSGATLRLQGDEPMGTVSLSSGSIVEYYGIDGTPVTIENWSYKTLNITGAGRQYNWNADETYTVTEGLNITGSSGNLILLRSTSEDTRWTLDTTSVPSVVVSYANVKDSNAVVTIITSNSVDGGNNNTNWVFTSYPSYTWTNVAGDGLWSTAGNWAGGIVPSSGSEVYFDGSVTNAGSSMDIVNLTIASLTIQNGYSGTITLNNSGFAVGSVTLNSGAFNQNGYDFNVSGGWENNGATRTGSGTLHFTGSGNIKGGDSGFGAVSFENQPYHLTGTFRCASMSIPGGGTFFQDGWDIYVSGSWSNSGGNWMKNGTVHFTGSGTIYQESTAPFDILSIEGNYQLSVATGCTSLVIANGGTLDLNGTSGVDIAAISVNSGGTLKLQGTEASMSTPTLNSGSTVEYYEGTGAGSLNNWTYSNLTISGVINTGTQNAAVSGILNISGTFTPSGGTITMNTGSSITKTGTLTFNNLIVAGNCTVNNGFNVGGTLDLTSGTFTVGNNAITVTGLATISGGTYSCGSATQTFNGGLTISGGTFTGSTGAVDVNGVFTFSSGSFTAPSGAFNVQGNWAHTGGSFIYGTGTITFDGGTGTTQTLNSGGAIYYNIGHSGAGTLQLITNDLVLLGTLVNSAGTFDANGKAVTAYGLTTISGGTYSASSGAQTFSGLTLSGGTFNGGSATITVNGTTTVSSGTLTTTTGTMTTVLMTINSPGIVRMASNGILKISGSGTPLTGNGTLDISTNTPNTIEYTGQGTTDITLAGPLSGYHNLQLIPGGYANVGSLIVQLGEDRVRCAVIDTAGGFAYFGTETTPGIIIKVRLSDFTRVGAITLNNGEDSLITGVIDTVNSYAYFGTRTIPGIVVKIDLSNFSRVSSLTFNSGEGNIRTGAVIDDTNGYAYFPIDGSPGKIIKVQLSDFTRVGSLTFNSGENSPSSGIIDIANQLVYFGTSDSPGRIVKVNLATFSRVSAITLESGENNLVSAVIDTANNLAYFGTWTSPGKVVKVDLTTFTRSGVLTLNSGENILRAGVIDTTNGFAYFSTDTSPSKVIKIQLSDFTRSAAINLNTHENNALCAVIDTANGLAYFGTWTTPGKVAKVDINPANTFAELSTVTFNEGESGLKSAVIDTLNGFAYFGTSGTPGVVIKIRLSNFTRVGAITLNSGENDLYSAVIDTTSGYAYFGTYTTPGIVVKINLTTFTREGSLTLNSGESLLSSATIDVAGGYAYFGTNTNPAKVVRVKLSDFTRDSVLTFNSGDLGLFSAAIDTANHYAYFGSNNTPALVLKVDLNNFDLAHTSRVTLSTGEDSLRAVLIDTINNYLYVGTNTSPGIVVKIDLASFTRVGSLTLNSGENLIRTAVIDAANDYAYFACDVSPGRVVKIKLSDLSRVDALTFTTNKENGILSSTIDTTAGYAYFGTNFPTPSRVVKVSLGSTSMRLGTASGQTLTINGSLTIGDGTNAAAVTAAVYNPAINVTGNVTINANASLTASSSAAFNVTGNWVNSGTFTHNNGTVTFNAGNGTTQTLNSGGSSFYNLTHSGAGTLRLVTNALTVGGTFTNSAGTFDTDTNDLAFTSAGLATVSGGTFLASSSATMTFNGGLTISGGAFTGSSGTVDVNGNVSISSGTLTAPSGAFTVSGNWNKTGGTFTAGNNTVTFDAGTGLIQTLNTGGTSFTDTFYSVIHSGAGTLQLITSEFRLDGNLLNTNGILDTNNQNVTMAGGSSFAVTVSGGTYLCGTGMQDFYNLTISGGTFDASSTSSFVSLNNDLTLNSGTLNIGTANFWTFGSLIASGGTMTGTGTVIFYLSSGTQTINSTLTIPYAIRHTFGGTLRLSTNSLTTSGTFTNSFGIFDANGLAATFGGLVTVSGGEYQAKTATQTFNGGLTISGGVFTGSSGTVDVNGTFTISSGTFTVGSGTLTFNGGVRQTGGTISLGTNYDIEVYGDWESTGGTITGGEISFRGEGTTRNLSSSISLSSTIISAWINTTLKFLTSVNAGTIRIQGGASNAVIDANNQAITVGIIDLLDGAYYARSGTHTINGYIRLRNSSPIFYGNAATINLTGYILIENGTFSAPDSSGALNMTGDFTVNSGATFTPNTGTITFNGSGVSTVSGSSTFYNLACTTPGKTLTFTRDTEQIVTHDLTITGTSASPIIINDTGAGAVPKLTVQSGASQNIQNVNVTNNDASAGLQLRARGSSTLSGSTLNWILGTTPTTFTWTGNVSTDWNTAGNWDLGLVPSDIDDVVIPVTANQPVLASSVTLNSLILNGTLNAGSLALTVTRNITGSGTIQGVNPVISAGGYIGTRSQAVGISVSGTLSMHAGAMLDDTSIYLSGGAGSYNWQGAIPGFIFVNGGLRDWFGQSSIRQTLTSGMSPLYLGPGNFVQPVYRTAPLLLPPMPGGFVSAIPVVAPVPVAVPFAVPAAPQAMPAPSFIPAAPLPQAAELASAVIPKSEPVAASVALPQAQSTDRLPPAVPAVTFERPDAEKRIRLMFPGGTQIIPVFGVRLPMGAEGELLQPSIKEDKDK